MAMHMMGCDKFIACGYSQASELVRRFLLFSSQLLSVLHQTSVPHLNPVHLKSSCDASVSARLHTGPLGRPLHPTPDSWTFVFTPGIIMVCHDLSFTCTVIRFQHANCLG